MKTLEVHYKGTLEDGTVFDSSYDRGQPLKFETGRGAILPKFEETALTLEIGAKETITIPNAYGDIVKEAIIDIPKEQFPPDFEVKIGEMVHGQGPDGRPIQAKIVAENEDGSLKLDHNHPLAGKDLTFEIELVSSTGE
jgi:peptidylprolyl isomerase